MSHVRLQHAVQRVAHAHVRHAGRHQRVRLRLALCSDVVAVGLAVADLIIARRAALFHVICQTVRSGRAVSLGRCHRVLLLHRCVDGVTLCCSQLFRGGVVHSNLVFIWNAVCALLPLRALPLLTVRSHSRLLLLLVTLAVVLDTVFIRLRGRLDAAVWLLRCCLLMARRLLHGFPIDSHVIGGVDLGLVLVDGYIPTWRRRRDRVALGAAAAADLRRGAGPLAVLRLALLRRLHDDGLANRPPASGLGGR